MATQTTQHKHRLFDRRSGKWIEFEDELLYLRSYVDRYGTIVPVRLRPDRQCKICYGRGWDGRNASNRLYNPCTCLKPQLVQPLKAVKAVYQRLQRERETITEDTNHGKNQ